ncbi:hypothetical protein CARUB_v10000837mg [Capsella rubella]|uniref:DUF674 family protein n=1 Tax=Capsella rubella TaxID=81985 RepID=R0HAB3_9BRAS|nr:uncharacterized protein LOC17883751 [Capsella rubella]EOA20523.1 hypothetical protein CARUB_v10000837mg [Capsella rubella]
MAEVSEDPKFTLRLLVDEEKNKVFLAEAGRDFVDVLFSLLTLPMGTIVRLIEKHRKCELGCFSNLYKSVADVGIENFETEACQQILLNPRSVKEIQCKRLKLNINPTDDLKYFKCCMFSACNLCTNFSGFECVCGELMDQEIELSEEDQVAAAGGSIHNGVDGVFVKGRSSFIITDDFLVSVGSTGLVLETLNRLGCSDVSKLAERFLHIGLAEILTLLEYMFFSNTPLTSTFLKKQSPDNVYNIHKLLSPGVKVKTDDEKPEFTFELDAIVRKQDMKILYVECGEDFVDLLFTFLAVPLQFLCDSSLGCIGNLSRSFKELSVVDTASKCVLPYYYKCQKQLPHITTEEPPVYYRYRNSNPRQPDYSLTTDPDQTLLYRKDKLIPVTLIDPRSLCKDHSENDSGFMKRGTRFTVTDDLIITPRNSLSTSICLLKKLKIQADDLEVQVISIREAEAMSLMRASLLTSSALNSAFWNLIAKKIKVET